MHSTGEFTFDYYRAMLGAARNSGYSFAKYGTHATDKGDRLCLLRHDCDNDMESTLPIGRIEAEYGVASTFFVMLRSAMYNALSLPNIRIMAKLLELGHDIGLHFDEFIVRNLPAESVADEVDNECSMLSKELGVPIRAVSFHQPGNRVLENVVKIRQVNTYDREDMAGFHYISDSWGKMRADLVRVFSDATYPRLQLLLHTEWWSEGAFDRASRWRGVFSRNFAQMQTALLDREPAYETAHEIAFTPLTPVEK